MIGVMPIREAVQLAYDQGLDLVEIAAAADPPVCKILDVGKFKYEIQKKKNEARKKQKVIEVKEIKMRPGIDEHDYQVKLRSMRRFLEEGDKVKATIQFRGREMSRLENGRKVLQRLGADLEGKAHAEGNPEMLGNRMHLIFAPPKKH